ncbi:hypothetical protein H1235_07390 [Pseudoxanthomonas sp. NC8]|nr:hypothetical protein H1235_07390 [Pseudoxanthomonas sp. NC8]
MKLEALRRQRLDLLADLQARNQDAVSQRELQRMRYEDRIRSLNAEKSGCCACSGWHFPGAGLGGGGLRPAAASPPSPAARDQRARHAHRPEQPARRHRRAQHVDGAAFLRTMRAMCCS